MLKWVWGLLSGGATGCVGAAIGGAKLAVIAAAVGAVVYYVDDYIYLGKQNIRLDQALAASTRAYESQVQARRRDAYHHQRELAAYKAISDMQFQVAEDMAALSERLAALSADPANVHEVSPALQEEIDRAKQERSQP